MSTVVTYYYIKSYTTVTDKLNNNNGKKIRIVKNAENRIQSTPL